MTNAQHLDVLNGFPGFNSRFIPLHHYFIKALDLMYDHLTKGTSLPPSQVIRATPRGENPDGSVPELSEGNLPSISSEPGTDALITFTDKTVYIPQ